MNWKLKAGLQNVLSMLPTSASYAAYYWMQRRFGGLRHPDPARGLTSAIEAWRKLTGIGFAPTGKVFLEIGTGRMPVAPVAYWLMGARETISIDVNPYLQADVTAAAIGIICNDEKKVRKQFGSLLVEERLEALKAFHALASFSMDDVLDLCRITYRAPCDSAKSGVAEKSVDVHVSFRVLEHVPPQVLPAILEEGNRVVAEGGVFVHRIDYSDHFSHSDPSISKINFLQFSDKEWDRYAGNRYMYMNRLRHDDFLELFETAGHRLLTVEPDLDARCLESLRSGEFRVDEKFRSKPPEMLAITGAWIVSTKQS